LETSLVHELIKEIQLREEEAATCWSAIALEAELVDA
jgi:hypothetical protein